jgi:YNFM family putative membrane transporter
VLAPAVAAALFFTFVGVFSYASFRLRQPPFGFGPAAASLVFGLWALGAVGVLGSLPPHPVSAVLALAVMTLGMFAGVTAAQLGLAAAGSADRGAASAIYFSFSYGAGALAGFVPGPAWEAEGWLGVVAVAAPALSLGAVGLQWAARAARPPVARRR